MAGHTFMDFESMQGIAEKELMLWSHIYTYTLCSSVPIKKKSTELLASLTLLSSVKIIDGLRFTTRLGNIKKKGEFGVTG